MNKLLGCMFAVALQFGSCHAADTIRKQLIAPCTTVSSLTMIAQRYMDFMSDFGSVAPSDTIVATMESLFAQDCHKIVNGKIITRTIQELYEQITAAKEFVGGWDITSVTPFIAHPESNTVIVHFAVPTERHGTHLGVKFLTCDSNGLITQIDEVYNLLDETH